MLSPWSNEHEVMIPVPRQPVTYEVMENGKLVLEYWQGDISRDELILHSQQHLTDSRVIPGASALADARGAQFSVNPEDVPEIVDRLYAAYAGRLRIGKCAVLVSDQAYGLARTYERVAGKYGINVIVFTSLDVACRWLGVDMEVVEKFVNRARSIRGQA